MTIPDPGQRRRTSAEGTDAGMPRPEPAAAARMYAAPSRPAEPPTAAAVGHVRFVLALVDRLGSMDDPQALSVAAAHMLADHLGDARADFVDWQEVRGPAEELAAIRRILLEGRAVVIDGGTRGDAARRSFTGRLAGSGTGAQVIAPVVRDGHLVAALSVERPASRRWSPDEVALIEDVAARTAAAVERARGEAARRQLEASYPTLFEAMDRGFAVWDVVRGEDGQARDTRCVEMNPAFERLTALRRAESIGRPGSELLGESAEWWLRTCARVLAAGESIRFEHHLGSGDRWHEVAVSPLGRDRVAALYDDITRRKRVEAALAGAAERDAFQVALGDAFRPLTDPAAIKAASARMLAWHLGARGVHYGELEADELHVEVAHERPPHLPGRYLLAGFPRLAVHMKAGKLLSVEDVEADPLLRPRERDSYRALGVGALVAVPLLEGERLVAVFVVQREAAYRWPADELSLIEETAQRTWAAVERARAERAVADDLRDTRLLRELGSRMAGEGDARVLHDEVIATALTLASADGGALHIVDPATDELALLAARGLGPVLRERLTRLAAGSSIPAVAARVRGRRVAVELPAGRSDPALARVHAESGFRSTQATPLLARSGEVIGVLSTFWRRSTRPGERELRFLDLLARQAADLIEGLRSTQTLRDLVEVATAARREAEAANRAKDDFLAVLSHELRTPLTPIVLWGRMLLDGHVPLSDLGRAVQVIVTSAERQSRLIEDLLDLSRITGGRLSLQPESTDVAALARAAIELVRPTADERRQTIALELGPEVGRAVLDPRRFEQVLWNVLSNAVKFTPEGGRITVRVRADGGRLVVEVIDTGEGMSAEFLPLAFERFRQANMGEDRPHGGLGIGLALCHELVQLHRGSIEARSEGLGRGSVFTITIPLERAAGDAPVSADPASPARPRSG